MHAPPAIDPRSIDPRLRRELRRMVRRVEAHRLHRHSALAWIACALALLAVLVVARETGATPLSVVAGMTALVVACGALVARWWAAPANNYAAAAAFVEGAHPELRHALRTALEQRPDSDGNYTFLQDRVIEDALAHAYRHFWSRTPVPRARRAALLHVAALVAACALPVLALRLPPAAARASSAGGELAALTGLRIEPGDAEVERGSTVVFTAHFGPDIPRTATLRWRTPDGAERSAPMARSLSDPVFATTLPHLATDIDYTVAFDDAISPAYRITVYDLPRMVRGDAALDYPDFTGLEARTIEDTRRISAVEGTRLDYTVLTNKPVRDAYLRAKDGATVPLTPANPERTRFTVGMTIAESARYTVQLTDDDGRTDRDPSEVRIEALPNRRPQLTLAFPRGDQRVSALEEITVQATAADDFGLLDYGIAWSIGDAEPNYLSHRPAAGGPDAAPSALREASFEQLLALEPHAAEPGSLVTWFAWADDLGADGAPRRTHGDLAFGEVRPFDEIFRESEGGAGAQAGQAGGAGDEAAELLELQRDISVAIWKLRDRPPQAEAFREDVATLEESQQEARRRLAQVASDLEEPAMRAAADTAAREMTRTAERLGGIRAEPATPPLQAAWTSSQAAYQALLRMQPRETEVGQERSARSGQSRSRGNQRQLDQLRFKDEQDRYETESEAQLATTPEQREQMQTLARLRELARRQSGLNERLQQLQTALEAAADDEARAEIERELKRLEEEQRRMLAELDDLRQRMDSQAPGQNSTETREQVERTREDMRRAGDALEERAVSRALAAGTRAEEGLEEAREQMRDESSSRFSEDMREMRRTVREIAEAQEQTRRELDEARRSTAPSLDDSSDRSDLASGIEENRETLAELRGEMRRVTEEAEELEPGLHRQLYDLLREQAQGGGADDRMGTAAELLRRGFVDQARELQPGISESVDQLARGIERAAESVLGDEASTLRFAQAELDQLAREIGSGEPVDSSDTPAQARGGETSGEPGEGSEQSGSAGEGDALARALTSLSRERAGGSGNPITEGDFGGWEERLRTVEALLDAPDARERLAGARELAAALRREFHRHGAPPLPETVESGIVAPLSEVRAWLRQELARREDPASLQPVDQDPVPEVYAEAVRRYYEALGASNTER